MNIYGLLKYTIRTVLSKQQDFTNCNQHQNRWYCKRHWKAAGTKALNVLYNRQSKKLNLNSCRPHTVYTLQWQSVINAVIKHTFLKCIFWHTLSQAYKMS